MKKISKPWTEGDLNKLKEMKRGGFSAREISEEIGRTKSAIAQKLTEFKGEKGSKRKYTKRAKAKTESQVVAQATRPMVAFVGTHNEITSAIKELFS